jgi:hypothetical protein
VVPSDVGNRIAPNLALRLSPHHHPTEGNDESVDAFPARVSWRPPLGRAAASEACPVALRISLPKETRRDLGTRQD